MVKQLPDIQEDDHSDISPEYLEALLPEIRAELLEKHTQHLRREQAEQQRFRASGGLEALFQQWHEIHIRWVSSKPYTASAPFTSRLSPGLHVFFTPLEGKLTEPLCNLLKQAFGPDQKCKDTNETFIKLPIQPGSERFSMSASSEYYSYVTGLSYFIGFVGKKLCPQTSVACKGLAHSLWSASSLDIDYDTISHAIVLTAYWPDAPMGGSWTETITTPTADSIVEIGVLVHEPVPDPEDIGFSGFLTVLGQDTSPAATRFQTPTRHYPLPSSSALTYRASFSHPTGLHPTLLLTLSRPPVPPNPTCKLHTHLTLPSPLFLDKHAFHDPLALSSHHLSALHSLSGATDLEAPDWVTPEWGSAALFEIALPQSSSPSPSGEWNTSIPLHLRYLPASTASHARVAIPWPVVFWACRADEGAKMASSPFDRVHLGYEGLFGVKTRFMHVEPKHGDGDGNRWMVEWIEVPVLDLRGAGWVERGTVGVVVLAFLGLCWALFGRVGAVGKGKGKAGEKKKQ
ncbi:PIG-X-domain-containing protein [Polyplosphaeria fusca]|uniref:Protein PBN1 n=1 Tax=Polyplosphaeria fusca TaxID=682080 RepID=A0A9P4R7V8_9PLEO|nr:PIG-X-domain-containing protein [Polyplosphaeria fusca]